MSKTSGQTNATTLQIRYLDPARVDSPGLIAEFHNWLDDHEKARLARLGNPEHHHGFLVSHALTRKMLADAMGCKPAEIEFAVTGRHKPVVVAPVAAPTMHFNLSHTQGLVMVALDSAPVGVDAEWLGRKTVGLELAKRYFTATELADIENQPPSLQPQRFLTYWTLKEAYLKAQAWGIVDSLNGFEFELSPANQAFPNRIRLRIRDAKLTPTHPWRFHHWQIGQSHLASLATSTRRDPNVAIDLRAWSEDDWNQSALS